MSQDFQYEILHIIKITTMKLADNFFLVSVLHIFVCR